MRMRRFAKAIWSVGIILALLCQIAVFPALAAPEDDAEDAAGEVQIPDEGENCETLSTPASSGLILSASAALLMDAESGRVLYAYHAQEQSLIASTTKIMTALLAIETCNDLDETVTVCDECIGVEGSSMYLEKGDQVSVRCLLYGLMLQSGNDAAVALADHCAGSVDVFVTWMNDYAQKLGMTRTHFSNPHGLNDDDHYSTAEDMAILMRAALKEPVFREIISSRYAAMDGFELYNHNKLLGKYEYCIGGKTGYTQLAGRTLVTAAEKNGQTLIAVTFNAPDDWNDHIAMYEYGFSHYPLSNLATRGSICTWLQVEGCGELLPVRCTRDLRTLVVDGDACTQTVTLPEKIEKPVEQGAIIGKIAFEVNGVCVGETFLEDGASVTMNRGEGTAITWNSGCKNFSPLPVYCLAGRRSGTYWTDGSLWMASSRPWG